MKFVFSQINYFLRNPGARTNLRALRRYLFYLLGTILCYSILFHVIMIYVEGESHSWLTGLYWTLTVMSTLGFGDVTFASDIGRLFSIIVLMSGIILLLIMLPFTFIQNFYAPWLEAKLKTRVPNAVPEDMKNHVIICKLDSITKGLLKKLQFNNIPYFVIEHDPVKAGYMQDEGMSVIVGDPDSTDTHENLNLSSARLVLANDVDTANTNIVLTIRQVDADVPIIALADEKDSIDILELSGADYVLPLKIRLGEIIAAKTGQYTGGCHVIGSFRELQIVEFLINGSKFDGMLLSDSGIRERTGMSIVGVWNEGKLHTVNSDYRFSISEIPVAIGTEDQVRELNKILKPSKRPPSPVLVIGGGKVGQIVTKFLSDKKNPVFVLDKKKKTKKLLDKTVDRLTIGNAADRNVLDKAGINEVNSVVLTTNDDAMNIHLAVYCRSLNPKLNIISRITLEKNIEALYRAGADFVISFASLGRESIFAFMMGRDLVMLGEGTDFYVVNTPEVLIGKTLGESGVGARTGLIIVAIDAPDETIKSPPQSTILVNGSKLVMLGNIDQMQQFTVLFDEV